MAGCLLPGMCWLKWWAKAVVNGVGHGLRGESARDSQLLPWLANGLLQTWCASVMSRGNITVLSALRWVLVLLFRNAERNG